jgi:hypothetical protein
MSLLEDVVASQLEEEGHILVEAVAEHMLLHLRSQDPQVSLELVVQGHAEQILEATQVRVQEALKVVSEQFERWPEDA